MRYMRHIAIICLAVLALAGCVTTHMYEGPELPPEEVAVLEVFYFEHPFAMRQWRALFVDGEEVGRVSLLVHLLPGTHEVDARKDFWDGSWWGGFFFIAPDCAKLNVVVEAGETYQFEELEDETLLIVDGAGNEVARSPVVPCT